MGLNKSILNKIEKKYGGYKLNKETENIKDSISKRCINVLKEDKLLIVTKLGIYIPILVLLLYLNKSIN